MVDKEHTQLVVSSVRSVQGATTTSGFDLSHYVRQSFSLLLRIIHLEFHLFETLFLTDGNSADSDRVVVAKGAGEKWITSNKGHIEKSTTSHDQLLQGSDSVVLSGQQSNNIARWSTDSMLIERASYFVKITDAMCGQISGAPGF